MNLFFSPSHRRLWRRVGAVVGVGALVVAGMAWNRHLNAAPVFAVGGLPTLPVPNAFDDFNRAASLHREPRWSDYERESAPTNYPPAPKKLSAAEVDAAFAQNTAALAALRVGLTHAYMSPLARQSSDAPKVRDHAESMRSLARTLAFEAQHRAERGDLTGAVECGLDGIEMGVMVPRGGGTFDRVCGHQCDATERTALWPLVGRLDAAQAMNAARRLEGIESKRTPLTENLRTNEWSGLVEDSERVSDRSVRAAYTDYLSGTVVRDDVSGAPLREIGLNPRDGQQMLRDWAAVELLTKQQFVDNYQRWMEAQIVQARLPYGAQNSVTIRATDPFNRILVGWNSPVSYGHLAAFADAEDETGNGLLQVALALHAYHLEHGSYPPTLAELVRVGIIRSVPTDLFAKAVGSPLIYRPVAGNKYLLYSVGPDGMDDGGRPIDWMYGAPARYWGDLSRDDRGDWVVD